MALSLKQRGDAVDETAERFFRMRPGELGVAKAIREVFLGEDHRISVAVRRAVEEVGREDCLEILSIINRGWANLMMGYEGGFLHIANAVTVDRATVELRPIAEVCSAHGRDAMQAVASSPISDLSASKAPRKQKPVSKARQVLDRDAPKFRFISEKGLDATELEELKQALRGDDLDAVKKAILRCPGLILEEFNTILESKIVRELLLFIAQEYPNVIIIYSPRFLDKPFAYEVIMEAARRDPKLAIKLYAKYEPLSGSEKILAEAETLAKSVKD
ncbi:MAG: hypothetical protein UT33_C0008G0038 [Candidatus Peregrinibacteria bacterium GW2011_GWC2_39_14]|nr:MAG: hypothetical protein US92_C0004G0038 [Candidatus Peregrinibacteria bacterium GW2011_GWA2_38_36]KKR06722.1 MAG: hypothetical protein UT33_C0008G0038 [Candidatus Peregrinibacteria bacterium GW2011_GWC2_39_14]